MNLRSTTKRHVTAALALAIAAASAQAQTPQQLEERRLQYNEEKRREVERSGAPSGGGSDGLFSTPTAPVTPGGNTAGNAALAAALDKARRNYERQPPLPADRNRLLGRWTLDTSKRKPANMLEELAGALGNNCALLWGSGVWEFRPKQLVNAASSPVMAIATEYRGSANTVAVLPKEFFRLLVFEFVAPDRVRETVTASELATCEFVRVGAAAAAAGGGAATAGRPGTTPQVAAAAPGGAAGGPTAEVGCRQPLLDQLGRVRVADAQRVVLASFANVQSRTLPNGHTQFVGTAGRCHDARLHATVYDFDPAGVLQQVSMVWRRPEGPVPSPLFTERATHLARLYDTPAPQTPGRLRHALPDRRIVLEEVPPQGFVVESYVAVK